VIAVIQIHGERGSSNLLADILFKTRMKKYYDKIRGFNFLGFIQVFRIDPNNSEQAMTQR
jgi:hypothetical protein